MHDLRVGGVGGGVGAAVASARLGAGAVHAQRLQRQLAFGGRHAQDVGGRVSARRDGGLALEERPGGGGGLEITPNNVCEREGQGVACAEQQGAGEEELGVAGDRLAGDLDRGERLVDPAGLHKAPPRLTFDERVGLLQLRRAPPVGDRRQVAREPPRARDRRVIQTPHLSIFYTIDSR